MLSQQLRPTTQIPSQGMDWYGGRFIHLQSELPQVGIVSVPIEVHDHYTMAPFKQSIEKAWIKHNSCGHRNNVILLLTGNSKLNTWAVPLLPLLTSKLDSEQSSK